MKTFATFQSTILFRVTRIYIDEEAEPETRERLAGVLMFPKLAQGSKQVLRATVQPMMARLGQQRVRRKRVEYLPADCLGEDTKR